MIGTIEYKDSAPNKSEAENETKNETKNEAKNQEAKKPIQDELGSGLGRSWVVLGAVLGPWKRSRHYACRCFVKIHVFQKISFQEPS